MMPDFLMGMDDSEAVHLMILDALAQVAAAIVLIREDGDGNDRRKSLLHCTVQWNMELLHTICVVV